MGSSLCEAVGPGVLGEEGALSCDFFISFVYLQFMLASMKSYDYSTSVVLARQTVRAIIRLAVICPLNSIPVTQVLHLCTLQLSKRNIHLNRADWWYIITIHSPS